MTEADQRLTPSLPLKLALDGMCGPELLLSRSWVASGAEPLGWSPWMTGCRGWQWPWTPGVGSSCSTETMAELALSTCGLNGESVKPESHLLTSIALWRTDKNGTVSLGLVSSYSLLGISVFCRKDPGAAQSPSPPNCATFFLPHQPLFYACVCKQASELHFCSVTLPETGRVKK